MSNDHDFEEEEMFSRAKLDVIAAIILFHHFIFLYKNVEGARFEYSRFRLWLSQLCHSLGSFGCMTE